MIMMWLIYLIGNINAITGLSFLVGAIFILWVMARYWHLAAKVEANEITEKEGWRRFKKSCLILAPVSILFISIGILLPNSQTLAAMYLIPKLAANQQLQQISDKGLTLLNAKLDDWIKQAGNGS